MYPYHHCRNSNNERKTLVFLFACTLRSCDTGTSVPIPHTRTSEFLLCICRFGMVPLSPVLPDGLGCPVDSQCVASFPVKNVSMYALCVTGDQHTQVTLRIPPQQQLGSGIQWHPVSICHTGSTHLQIVLRIYKIQSCGPNSDIKADEIGSDWPLDQNIAIMHKWNSSLIISKKVNTFEGKA